MSKRKTTTPTSPNTTTETKEPLRGADLVKSKKVSAEKLKELGLADRHHLVLSFYQPPRKK